MVWGALTLARCAAPTAALDISWQFRGAMAALGLIPQGHSEIEGGDLNAAAAAVDAVFCQLDPDRSGAIEFEELVTLLRKAAPKRPTSDDRERERVHARERRVKEASERRQHSLGVSFLNRGHKESHLLAVEAAQGDVSGRTVQRRLRDELKARWARVIDLLRAWDTDGDGMVDRKEFLQAMRQLGMGDARAAIEGLFLSFDHDGSGLLSFSELHQALRQRPPSPSLLAVSAQQRTIIPPGGRPRSKMNGAHAGSSSPPLSLRQQGELIRSQLLYGHSSRVDPAAHPTSAMDRADGDDRGGALSARRHEGDGAPAQRLTAATRAAPPGSQSARGCSEPMPASTLPLPVPLRASAQALRVPQALQRSCAHAERADAARSRDIRVPPLPPCHIPKAERSIATRQYNRRPMPPSSVTTHAHSPRAERLAMDPTLVGWFHQAVAGLEPPLDLSRKPQRCRVLIGEE